MMIEVYKIYHNIGPVYMGDLFNKVDQLYHSRSVKSLQQPRFNSVTYGRDSFSYQGAKEWNVLDNFIKDAASLNDFKILIKAWNGKQCICSYCHVCILERV